MEGFPLIVHDVGFDEFSAAAWLQGLLIWSCAMIAVLLNLSQALMSDTFTNYKCILYLPLLPQLEAPFKLYVNWEWNRYLCN